RGWDRASDWLTTSLAAIPPPFAEATASITYAKMWETSTSFPSRRRSCRWRFEEVHRTALACFSPRPRLPQPVRLDWDSGSHLTDRLSEAGCRRKTGQGSSVDLLQTPPARTASGRKAGRRIPHVRVRDRCRSLREWWWYGGQRRRKPVRCAVPAPSSNCCREWCGLRCRSGPRG